MGKMDDKVVLVTGGARGQGRSHAIRMAEEGADVVVTDICKQLPYVDYAMGTPEELEETRRHVEKLGRRCLAYQVDARDRAGMREAVDTAVAELGRLDAVIVNHGIAVPHTTLGPDHDDDVWDLVMDVNLNAVWRTVRAVVPHLKENGGSITVTSSAAGLVALFGRAAYVASKHGVIGLVKTLAAELAPYWIRVNAVCPTGVDTPLYLNQPIIEAFTGKPNGTREDMIFPATSLNLLPVPWIEPVAVSHAMLFLASDEARYITGVALPVDAGMTTQPPGITPYVGQRLAELGN
ncbi:MULTISPECIES: mycofactocin-coupled SDR family oxidoreductase [unclassified Pseudofrankia]|uniref:mycofactocin-coupled SDR family oxidoreductase n=1 Tax=unclassified Pseudofrankia TaxID=2994372 RepID=UPI0009F27C7D|nr:MULTISPECIES: mycofactocin-coupled SDR family oxidoreductase [unclassified Pseudofrankia]MDT3444932.1 mycofactocin-coupled SDR family oxidoreductase [Pseudofrankia sp. BMG5.37]